MSHSVSVAVADGLRVVTIAELGLCAGLTCALFAIYLAANQHIRKVDPKRAGTLLRYVVTMTVSYFLLAIFAIAEIQGYYGTALTYRTPIGFLAANCGVYALTSLLRFENARLDVRDEHVTMSGSPGSEES